ncbi:MAG: hypothetical protein HY321_10570 [Armatimonadetes bacterium]|nr:hypothetical protein [Armatimonadota bacterium]
MDLLTTRPRASGRGEWVTRPEHAPPEKRLYGERTPAVCRHLADEVGEHCRIVVETILSKRPADNLRAAQLLVGLRERVGAERLIAAAIAIETPRETRQAHRLIERGGAAKPGQAIRDERRVPMDQRRAGSPHRPVERAPGLQLVGGEQAHHHVRDQQHQRGERYGSSTVTPRPRPMVAGRYPGRLSNPHQRPAEPWRIRAPAFLMPRASYPKTSSSLSAASTRRAHSWSVS